MVTKNILIILTAQDPKHIEPHNALPAFPRQDPLVEKKTYYTELANQVVSKVRLQAKIQQTKMLVTCQRFDDWFLFGLVWPYSSNQKNIIKVGSKSLLLTCSSNKL